MVATLDKREFKLNDGTIVGVDQWPLVSIIIVNYNYGRYLLQAVTSVYSQTYPNVECVVVDNASTDASSEIIQSLGEMHPRLAVVHRSANDGQSAASLDGFARSCGEYVIFMDADDYLLPSAVQTHVTVHLSSRVHVGFTSVDMLQMFHERIVLSTGEAINRYISRHQDARVDLLRDAGKAMGGLDVHPALAKGVYLVPPGPSEWVWSPTSGNCFRRDALLLFLDNPQLPELRTHTDYYLNMAVSSQFGSILIDEALFVYRLHDVNVSYGKPHLNGRLAFDPTKTAANERFARLLLIDHLARHFGRFVQEPWMRSRFFRTLNCLDIRNDDVPGPRWARKSRVASRLVLSKDQMCEAFGWSSTAWLLFRAGVPPWQIHSRSTKAERHA